MSQLLEQFKQLRSTLEDELHEVILREGAPTPYTIENGTKVKGEFYVEGRRVGYITDCVLVADGLHYQHDCLPFEELIEVVGNLYSNKFDNAD